MNTQYASSLGRLYQNPTPNQKKVLTCRIAIALILATSIFTHWPALISDSIMWDDWILLAGITQAQPNWIFQFFHNNGVTPFFLAYLPFITLTHNITATMLCAKILYFSSITINAILIMLISRRVAHGNLMFATLAGISAVCFPALSGEGFHLIRVNYAFFIPLFFLGLLTFSIVASSTRQRWGLRIIALTTLCASFTLNSLLVLFYALIPAIFYASLKTEQTHLRNLLANAKAFFIRHLDFLVLPLVFWALKETYMPREGVHAGHNTLNFDWPEIFHAYGQLIPDMLQTTLFIPLSIPFVSWVITGVLIVLMFKRSILARFENIAETNRNRLIILLGLGLLALFATALPYYLVGRRSFQAFGFMSRDNVLFPLSVSWITAASFCIFLKSPPIPQSAQSWFRLLQQRLVLSVFAVLIVSQSFSNWRNHLDWQAHYAYYRSVMEKIVRNKTINQASVIQVINRLPGDRSLLTFQYPTSIWTEIISAAFQETTRLAIPFFPENGRFFTRDEINRHVYETQIDYMLGQINLDGQQARLTIEPKNVITPIHLALAYWTARFFVPSDMPKLLDSLTQIKAEITKHE